VSTVVASVTPTSNGMYNVTATEAASVIAPPASVASWACSIVQHTASGHNVNPVRAGIARAAASFLADTAGTGAVFGGPASPIELICTDRTIAVGVAVYEADLTAVRVSRLNGVPVAGKPAHRPIMNHFVGPWRGRPAARSARSQTPH
jgi:hypothetical protein